MSRERSEGAALRDLLCKIQALNEGLAQDKIELNKIILLVRELSFDDLEKPIEMFVFTSYLKFSSNKRRIQFTMKNQTPNKTNQRSDRFRIKSMTNRRFRFLSLVFRNWSKSNKRRSTLKTNATVKIFYFNKEIELFQMLSFSYFSHSSSSSVD